jgi:hypothetical protein
MYIFYRIEFLYYFDCNEAKGMLCPILKLHARNVRKEICNIRLQVNVD